MPRKRAVTSRKRQDVTEERRRWKSKLDAECLDFLSAYRVARAAYRPSATTIQDLQEWLGQWASEASRFPEPPADDETRPVSLRKDVVEFLREQPCFAGLHEGENHVPDGSAPILQVIQGCTELFETDGEVRMAAYFALGLAYRLVLPFWERLRFEQFGKEPLDFQKATKLTAMLLEIAAKFLKGRWQPPKGRIDGERIALVNLIQAHALENLSPMEIRDALTYAGFSLPADDDTFRVWLHRARKRGLVETLQPIPRAIRFELNADGSIDWSSVEPKSRRPLLRALRRLAADPSESSPGQRFHDEAPPTPGRPP